MKKFILTDSYEAYKALKAAGFAGIGTISESSGRSVYGAFNSPALTLPEEYASDYILIDRMYLGSKGVS